MNPITHAVAPAWIGNEYSSVNPFNADHSRLLLIEVDHFVLYDGDGLSLADLPIGASQEPRWSRSNREQFYFIKNNEQWLFDLGVDERQILPSGESRVHAFTEYASIYGHGESDISPDGDHFVLEGTKQDGSIEVFVYSLKDGKGPVFPQLLPIDGLKITASNRILISRNSDPHQPTDGIFVLESTGERRLTDFDEHACPATYNGRDVLLWAESDTRNACVMIDVETGARKILGIELPWDYSIHISAPLHLPWCIVSTDCPDRKLPSQVWKVYFDATIPSEFLGNTASVFTGYNSEALASVSSDGSRLVGRSNFGQTGDPNFCNTWEIRLNGNGIIAPKEPGLNPVEIDKYGEAWLNMGSLPYDETSDLVCFSSKAKNVTVYRRK